MPLDFYETPPDCVEAVGNRIGWPVGSVLDAGAGTGSIGRVLHGHGAHVVGIEMDLIRCLQNKAFYTVAGDFLAAKGTVDEVWMNPPYGKDLALAFVQKALTLAERRVVALLRLNWLSSKKRKAFHRAHPAWVGVLERRPSFVESGATDATEYAWFVWDKTGELPGGQWEIL